MGMFKERYSSVGGWQNSIRKRLERDRLVMFCLSNIQSWMTSLCSFFPTGACGDDTMFSQSGALGLGG